MSFLPWSKASIRRGTASCASASRFISLSNLCGAALKRLPLAVAAISLAACGSLPPDEAALPGAAAPTALPTALSQIAGAPPIGIEAEAAASLPPLLATEAAAPSPEPVPASGERLACAGNTRRISLSYRSGEPFGAASRLLVYGDSLFLLADGGLYQSSLSDALATPDRLSPSTLLATGQSAAGWPVQELADIALDSAGQRLYALDKAGHLFYIDLLNGRPGLSYRALPDQDTASGLEPQLVAVAVDGSGSPLLLDVTQAIISRPGGFTALETVSESLAYEEATDLAVAGERIYVLSASGAIRSLSGAEGSAVFQGPGQRRLPLSLNSVEGSDGAALLIVDALRREATLIGLPRGESRARVTFNMPGIGLLRDAAYSGGLMLAVADGDLYLHDLNAANCTETATLSDPLLYDVDLLNRLQGLAVPIAGLDLPPWPRVYPGANRLYRLGVHRGLDIYKWSAAEGFDVGTDAFSVGAGQVIFATEDYRPMSEEEFLSLVSQTNTDGLTTDEVLRRLFGKHVVIDHGSGVQSLYAHLDEVDPAMRAGAMVQAGQRVGAVGLTGTWGESNPAIVAPHLHLELHISGRYLGYGISLRETMWWFSRVMPEA